MHVDTLELKYPSKLLFYFIFHLIYVNGCQYSFTIVLNVNKTNTIIEKVKLQQYKHFQKMLQISITEYKWIQKDLKIHHQNKTHTFM